MNPEISFIIPLYNESQVFNKLINRLETLSKQLNIDYEIILIDDGSSDDTPLLMENLALKSPVYQCIFLSRNFGQQYALSAGLKFSNGTKAIMILDGDLQDPPELFFEFFNKLNMGYDVIYGIRKDRKENIFKRSAYYLFYFIMQKISRTPVFFDSGDFSMLSRRVVNIIINMHEESRFIRGMRSWIGFKQIGIEYERDFRAAGEPKYTLRKLFKLANDGIFNFSDFPIKFLTIIGFACFMVSILYFIITVLRKILWGDVPVGFTALLFIIILFGGIQLVSIGIIGEYVSRIFSQVKNRPLYIVKQRIIKGEKIIE
jgi:glycosyltransferase involved in cell wall biosynthesis